MDQGCQGPECQGCLFQDSGAAKDQSAIQDHCAPLRSGQQVGIGVLLKAALVRTRLSCDLHQCWTVWPPVELTPHKSRALAARDCCLCTWQALTPAPRHLSSVTLNDLWNKGWTLGASFPRPLVFFLHYIFLLLLIFGNPRGQQRPPPSLQKRQWR